MQNPGTPSDVWLDITTLTRWCGKWTGIPRVIGSLAAEWITADKGLQLCRFNPATGDFEALAHEAFEELAEAQREKASPHPDPELEEPREIRRRRNVARSAYRLLPEEFRLAVRATGSAGFKWARFGYRCARFAVRAPVRAVRGRRPPVTEHVSEPGAPIFKRGDILFSPGGSWEDQEYIPAVAEHRRRGLRFVPFVHDLIPHRTPQFFPKEFGPLFTDWLRDLLRVSDYTLVNSNYTRKDLLQFAREQHVPVPRCEVVRLGDCLPDRRATECPPHFAKSHGADAPFALMVGTVEIRKNHYLIYQVWRRLLQEFGARVPRLVIAGRPGWLCSELMYQIYNDPVVKDRIAHLPSISDSQLNWLYANCLFTLYPSHYEGWGLPVSESLAHGKYCIASSSSSIPEVGGDLVDYHDPLDFTGCKRLIDRALFNAGYLAERERAIREAYRPVPWSSTARQVWGLLTDGSPGVVCRARRIA